MVAPVNVSPVFISFIVPETEKLCFDWAKSTNGKRNANSAGQIFFVTIRVSLMIEWLIANTGQKCHCLMKGRGENTLKWTKQGVSWKEAELSKIRCTRAVLTTAGNQRYCSCCPPGPL